MALRQHRHLFQERRGNSDGSGDGGGGAEAEADGYACEYDPSLYVDHLHEDASTQDSTSISHGSWQSKVGASTPLHSAAQSHARAAFGSRGSAANSNQSHGGGGGGGGGGGNTNASRMKQRGGTRGRNTPYGGDLISTARLLPVQHTHNGIGLGIDGDGTVFLDRRSGGQGTLFTISCDGRRATECRASGGKVVSTQAHNPAIHLPGHLNAKYAFLSEFVRIIKSRTAKVTCTTATAKFELMEDDGESFSAHFSAGHVVTVVGKCSSSSSTSSIATTVLKSGEMFTFALESDSAGGSASKNIPDLSSVSGWLDTAALVETEARRGHRLCKVLERAGDQSDLAGVFPIVAGGEDAVCAILARNVPCANATAADCASSVGNIGSGGGGVGGSGSGVHERPPASSLRFVAGVGWGSVSAATGETSLYALDGTAVNLNAAATEISILFPGQARSSPTVCSLKPDALLPDRIYPIIAALAKVVDAFR